MKYINNLFAISIIAMVSFTACQTTPPDDPVDPVVQGKLDAFAPFKLTTDLSVLSEKEKEMIPHLLKAAEQMEKIFWKQA